MLILTAAILELQNQGVGNLDLVLISFLKKWKILHL